MIEECCSIKLRFCTRFLPWLAANEGVLILMLRIYQPILLFCHHLILSTHLALISLINLKFKSIEEHYVSWRSCFFPEFISWILLSWLDNSESAIIRCWYGVVLTKISTALQLLDTKLWFYSNIKNNNIVIIFHTHTFTQNTLSSVKSVRKYCSHRDTQPQSLEPRT